jgi:uncharacterized membrane protein
MDLDVESGLANEIDAPSDDLTNHVVTVSLLQVALRAEARRMQGLLNEYAETADTTTAEGLFELLQQTSRLLLDYSRSWTHVLASSQTVNSIEEAEALYNRLLNQERSKFSGETGSNVNGQVRRQPAIAPINPEDPAYIVVTLLMGAADDLPLFDEIYSASMLRDTLDNIRLMQPRYLLVLETLWTPPDSNASLTEAELATDYADLSAIA